MSLRSKETLFDAALLRCGRGRAGSETALREALDANYDEIVRSALEEGDGTFSFGKTEEILTSRHDGLMGYDDAFVAPTKTLHIIEVFLNDCSCSDLREPWEYHAATGSILVNAREREVKIEFVREGHESRWSSAFAKAIQRRLEAVIKDFLEETEEAIAKDQDAEFQMLKAGVKGAKNRSANAIYKRGSGRLLRARRTRGINGYQG